MAITELDPSDAERLIPLFDEVQRLHVAAHPDLFREGATREERAAFLRDWLSDAAMHALVATEDEEALGYLIYEIRDRSDSVVRRANRLGFVHHIAVSEAHRGRRIGSRLIEAMKARLRRDGITALHSEYHAFNAASAELEALRITVRGKV